MGFRAIPARPAVRPASAFRPRPRALRVLAVLCALLFAACGPADVPRGLLRDLARELRHGAPVAPRLSVLGAPSCVPVPGRAAGCAAAHAPSGRIAALATRAGRAVRDRADPTALHAAALIDLLYEPGTGKPLQRAISSLQTAARLAERPAPVLADLAGAYLVRAERAHAPRDLLAAIETAHQALELDPANRAARYNLALALERLGLVEEAADAWAAYLARDGASAWAGQAREHLRRMRAVGTEPAPPAPGADPVAYAAYAAAEPQRARELGWCRVLDAWAAAALAGDAAGAEAHLRRAEALGTALARRPGGDATLADGVRAVRSARGPAARTLAGAHRQFAAGCRAEREVKFRQAAPRFAAAAAAAGASPALRAWARLHQGGAVFRGGQRAAGLRIAHPVAATADPARHPALAGGARMLQALMLLRTDRYDQAADAAEAARALFARAGERESEGAALETLSNARFGVRDPDGGYAAAARGLDRLRPYRASRRLHNLLTSLSESVADDGFPRAAVRVQDEGVRVAERTGVPVYVAEARLVRAGLLATTGAGARARDDLAAARAAMARVPDMDSTVRGWMVARQRMAESRALLRADPLRAAGGLDSAAAFFIGRMDLPLVGLPAVVQGAQARLAARDTARGTALLETALGILEKRRDFIRMEPRRAAVFEEARTLVDRVTMLRLASGDSASALRYLDRGRASLTAVGAAPPAGTGADAGRPGEVALTYALVGDTLLAWTVDRGAVSMHRAVVDRARLARVLERLRRQLEDHAGEAELRPDLSQLYDWLVRPVQARLGGPGKALVVVADGELGAVPFAALHDARRGRYLVQDHPMRFAASLREARRAGPAGTAGAGALFVADPAFDPREFPGFPRLAQAAREARQIAAGYPGARVLGNEQASRGALVAALASAGVVHYAGHAVFDDERPERSYLLLAPTPGGGGAARLEAGEIAELDLRHLSLVVLAACQTVRTGPGRAAGFSGLAGAFLAAGAGGAVGSLWQVDERLTRPLMVEFHNAYRAVPSGPDALRTAQLRLLRSADPALRSPAAWAGFRYAGR